MYHRWVTCHGNPKPDNEGIFQKSIAIWKSYENEGTTTEHQALDYLMKQFNHHLEVPVRIKQHAIFWFKEGSACVGWAESLARVLKRLKVKTAHYVSEDPGKILFEDKHQIMAVYNRRVRAKRLDS